MKRLSIVVLVAFTLISSSITLFLTMDYINRQNSLREMAFSNAREQAQVSADEISAAFSDVMAIANDLANDLSTGAQPYESIDQRLFFEAAKRPDIDGLAITFEPFVFDREIELYQSYIFQTETGEFDTLVGATYDYTQEPSDNPNLPNTSWYYDTVREGARWMEPFFAAGAQKILVEYGVPFYIDDEEEVVAGIVTIDYSLAGVNDLMELLQLGSTGYGFLISSEGTLLAHPISDYVARQTIFDLTEDEILEQTIQQAIAGEAQFIDTIDDVTGIKTWQFFEPIGTTTWIVGITLNQDEFLLTPLQLVRVQVIIALSSALTIFFITASIFYFDKYQITGLWAASNVFSLLAILLIVFIWWLTDDLHVDSGISIKDEVQLESYLERYTHSLEPAEPPIQIPTGILIQSMQFPNPTTVNIVGYIWQHYPVGHDIQVGVTLPQRIGVEGTIELAQQEVQDNIEIYVWYVAVELHQIYDVTQFPFDNHNITVRINPADLAANIMLVPDFESYLFVNPNLLPGLDTGVGISNWSFVSSGFSYLESTRNINWQFTDSLNQNVPELVFTIQGQRRFLGPFVAYLLPGVVAAVMMFTYIVVQHEGGDENEITEALSYSAALFFVVAIIHTGLRAQIAAVGITYLEYVYIMLYLAIVLGAANVFVIARYPNLPIVRYRNNIIVKLLYWPIFTGTLLLATLMIFVYS